MKISKKAWHYRLMMDFFVFMEPRSLCSYFWALVFALCVLCPLTIILAPVVLIIAPFALGYEYLQDRYYRWRSKKNFLLHTGQVISKPPGIVRGYIEAVKNKVCPLVEYTDE